jgi:hypothetical protein
VIDPAERLRSSIDPRRGTVVTTKAGAALVILPVMIRPIDILAGKVLAWQLDLLELRNSWAMAQRLNRKPDLPGQKVSSVAREVVAISYDISGGVVDEWFTDDDGETVIRICTAAMGAEANSPGMTDIRRRALSIALAGCGEIPMNAIELAVAADFAVNSGRAPEGA